MSFTTFEYLLFFLLTLSAFYLAPVSFRKPILLLASYVFYASWNWKFIPLLLSLTLIDYLAALSIEKSTGRRKRVMLVVSLLANLSFLFFFKYANFTIATLASVAGFPQRDKWFDVVLPLGISFHTFQSISYVVDVYRGQQQAIRKPVDYALFIAFFPQLIAGPIVRAEQFFQDLYDWRTPTFIEIRRGCFLAVMGLTKKLALADNFAIVADSYFDSVRTQTPGMNAIGHVFAFAMQIFFDFSAYTDMAIGFALLLGFHFPLNFRQPYLSISITDFWRRWHISLSTWLRDYLYIPLGGNRRGRARTYLNLILTMALGGLWHGASWNFVIWGGYHGGLLALERMSGLNRFRTGPWRLMHLPATLLTFALVCIGWVFFRAISLPDALHVLAGLLVWKGRWPLEPALSALAGFSLLITLLEQRTSLADYFGRCPPILFASGLGLLLFCTEMFSPEASHSFIYFQF